MFKNFTISGGLFSYPLRPSDAYMPYQSNPSLVQVMACRLIGWTNDDILSIWPWGTHFNDIFFKFRSFHSRKCIWKHCLQNGSHFVSALCVNGDGISYHYSDVIMGAIASQISSLKLFTQPFIQTQIKENIKAPRHWPLCGEFTGDWFDLTKDTPALSLWASLEMMGVLSSVVFWRKLTMVIDKDLIKPPDQQSWSGVY